MDLGFFIFYRIVSVLDKMGLVFFVSYAVLFVVIFCSFYWCILTFVYGKEKSYWSNFVSSEDKHDFKNHALDFLSNENKLFTSRVNLLLVAESLLFISYVTSLTTKVAITNNVHFFLCFIGIAVTILFCRVNTRSARNLERLKLTINEALPFHEKLRNMRKGKIEKNYQNLPFSTNITLSWVLSFIFLYIWFTLILLTLNPSFFK